MRSEILRVPEHIRAGLLHELAQAPRCGLVLITRQLDARMNFVFREDAVGLLQAACSAHLRQDGWYALHIAPGSGFIETHKLKSAQIVTGEFNPVTRQWSTEVASGWGILRLLTHIFNLGRKTHDAMVGEYDACRRLLACIGKTALITSATR